MKGERSLRETEKLLRSLTPENTSSATFLQRIQDLLLQSGISQEQLHDLAETVKPMPPAPRKPRAKRVRKPVLDAISAQLRERGVAADQGAQLATQLGEYFEHELGARTRELKQEHQQLSEKVRDLNRVLDQLGLAIIIWEAQGVVPFVHQSAARPAPAGLNIAAGQSLSPAVQACLKTLTFPLAAPDAALGAHTG